MQAFRTKGGSLLIAALLATSAPALAAPRKGDDAAAVAEANRAMAEQLAQQQAESDRLAREQQAIEDAKLTPKQRKAVEKKRKAEAAQRQKEADKARKQAEAKAGAAGKPKSNKVGKAVGGCLQGAIVGAIGGAITDAIFGGRDSTGNAMLKGAAVGCALGAVLGLTQKDEEQLNDYVDNDYALRDDVAGYTFDAPESKKAVALSRGETTYKQQQHKFLVAPDIAFDPDDIEVNERYMRSTASLRMRSAPTVAPDNIIGGFAPDDKLRTYGTTRDGKWAYVVERTGEGYVLLGYAATSSLSTALNVSSKTRIVAAKPTKVAAAPAKKTAKKQAAPVTASAAAPHATSFTAATACKATTLSSGGKSTSKTNCGGSAGLAFNIHDISRGIGA